MLLLILLVFCIVMFIAACRKNYAWMWRTVVPCEIIGLVSSFCYSYWVENLMPRSGYMLFEGFAESIHAFVSIWCYLILLLITVPICMKRYVKEEPLERV